MKLSENGFLLNFHQMYSQQVQDMEILHLSFENMDTNDMIIASFQQT